MALPAFAPDGSPVFIPEEQAEAAQAQGFKLDEAALARQQAQEAEAAKYDAPGLAGAAAAARGLTIGLSDQALTGSGLVAPQTLAKLQEHNPTASLLGEGLGMLAPLALTDGAAGAAEVGNLARLKGLITAPTRALGALGESAAGLGEAAGLGRLGQAAVRGAVEGAGYQIGNNLSDAAIEDHPLTAQALFHDVGTAAVLGGGLSGAVDKIVGAIAEHAPAVLEKANGALERLGNRAELGAEGAAQKAALRDADRALAEVVTHAEEVMPQRVRQLLQDAPPVPGLAEMLATALPAEVQPAVAKASHALEQAPDLASQHEALAALASKLEPAARADVERVLSSPTFGPAAAHRQGIAAALEPVQAARAAVDVAAPAERAAAVQAFKDEAQKALAQLQETTFRHVSGPTVSLDGLHTSLAGLHPDAPLTAAREGKSLLEHIESASPLLHMVPGAHHLAQGLAVVGAAGELATVARGGQSVTVARIARQASEALQTAQRTIEAAVSSSTASKAARVATASAIRDTSPEAVARRSAQVRALAAVPDAHVVQVGAAARLVGQHAPGVGQALTGTALRATQYLASQAPTDPRPPTIGPQSPWTPSHTEAQLYATIERAVLQPLSIASDMRAGRLTPAAVAAVAAVHPDLYARMTQVATDAAAARTKPMPYGRQLQLDVLLQRPVSAAAQAAPALLQAVQVTQAASSQPSPPRGSAAPDVASNTALKGTPLAT